VLAFTDYLSGNDIFIGCTRTFVNKVQRSADQMEVLIADLLDFARIQSGTFSVVVSADRLSQVVMPVIDRMRHSVNTGEER
jgi:signal transduction histidine kinase